VGHGTAINKKNSKCVVRNIPHEFNFTASDGAKIGMLCSGKENWGVMFRKGKLGCYVQERKT
jgi:hypothetical protein